MILRANEIQPEDLPHLYCTDPRLKNEVTRAKRLDGRSTDSVLPQVCAEPVNDEPISMPKPAA